MNIIRYWIKLRILHKERDQVHKKFKDVDPYEPDPEGHPKVFMMDPEYEYALRENEDKTQALLSKYITTKAETLHIPFEYRSAKTYWEKSDFTGRFYLSFEGMHKLKKEIRDHYSYYLLWFAAITGVLGALTGLIATIKA